MKSALGTLTGVHWKRMPIKYDQSITSGDFAWHFQSFSIFAISIKWSQTSCITSIMVFCWKKNSLDCQKHDSKHSKLCFRYVFILIIVQKLCKSECISIGHCDCCLEKEKEYLHHIIQLFWINWMSMDVASRFLWCYHCDIHGKIMCKSVTLCCFECNMSFCGSTKKATIVAAVCCFSNFFRSMQIISACLTYIKNWVEKVAFWWFERVLTTSDKNWKLLPLFLRIIVMKFKNSFTTA